MFSHLIISYTKQSESGLKHACFTADLIITMTTGEESRQPAPLISVHLHRIFLQPSNKSLHQSELDQPPVSAICHVTHVNKCQFDFSVVIKNFEELIRGLMPTFHQLFEAAASSESKGLGLWFLDSDHSTAGRHLLYSHASDLIHNNTNKLS